MIKKKNLYNIKIFTILLLVIFTLSSLLIPFSTNSKVNSDKNNQLKNNLNELYEVYYKDTEDVAKDVFVSGDFAYIANSVYGLAIINISDPQENLSDPIYIELEGGDAQGVFVDGDFAYIANGFHGLAIINISNPQELSNPVYCDINGNANEVYIQGTFAYVTDIESGLAIINISNPQKPELINYYGFNGGYASDICVYGNYAYVANYGVGLAIIDISDPINLGEPIFHDVLSHKEIRSVYKNEFYLYVGGGNELAIIYSLDPTNLGDSYIYNTYGETIEDIDVRENIAYLSEYNHGLTIINVSQPWNSEIINNIDTEGNAHGICVSGDYAFIANWDFGLACIRVQITDLIDPIIISAQEDLIVESGHSNTLLSWTAFDTYPNTYRIIRLGVWGAVAEGSWQSEDRVSYAPPANLGVGTHTYRIIFSDLGDNEISDDVVITVEDTIRPYLSATASDLILEEGYANKFLTWTATDPNPNTYTVTIEGTDLIDGPYSWTSANQINYKIPEGLKVGTYVCTINITDKYNHYNIDETIITVEDTIRPYWSATASDLILEVEYTNKVLNWTATDPNPSTYTIVIKGLEFIDGPNSWTSGNQINYTIPEGLNVGTYVCTINITDKYNHFNIDEVIITVRDTKKPELIIDDTDIFLEVGFHDQTISWIAKDPNPYNYIVLFNGIFIVDGPHSWTSGNRIYYLIPEDLPVNTYIYTINVTDKYNNFIIAHVSVMVYPKTDDNSKSQFIPGPNLPIFLSLSLFSIILVIIVIYKKEKIRYDRN
ncbi:MAG: hypothetical protein JXA99_14935 [Candidatus Lokiarchaeota archaeon]|nr:hypothetical protein [Candidatus Lokiarchaeota archaeon]